MKQKENKDAIIKDCLDLLFLYMYVCVSIDSNHEPKTTITESSVTEFIMTSFLY